MKTRFSTAFAVSRLAVAVTKCDQLEVFAAAAAGEGILVVEKGCTRVKQRRLLVEGRGRLIDRCRFTGKVVAELD